jgi:hypothetical protein
MRLQYGSSHASGAHAIALRSSSTTLCKGSSSAESGWMGALWFLMKPLRTYNGGSDHAASFPGTKRFSGNPSLFAGIPMIFPVILGNQLKMRLFQQKKENVAHVRKCSARQQQRNTRCMQEDYCCRSDSRVCSQPSAFTSRREASHD